MKRQFLVKKANHTCEMVLPESLGSITRGSMNSILQKTCLVAVPFLQSCFIERSIADTNAILKTSSIDTYYQNLLESDIYAKPLFNIPPTPLIYPDYFAGTYQAELTFQNGYFTPSIPFSALSQDVNIAGFRYPGVVAWTWGLAVRHEPPGRASPARI